MRNSIFVIACLALALSLSACSSNKSSPTAPVNAGLSQQQTSSGDSALATGDLSGANGFYTQALANDPGNDQARFGVAATSVVLLQDDPDVQNLLGYLGTPPVSARRGASAARLERAGALLVPSNRSFTPVAEGRAMVRLFGLALTNPPAISDVQHVIRTKVMPKLATVMDHMAVLEQHPNFVFKLPPNVTHAADTLEVDLGDVYLLDATVHGVQGFLGMVVAYNFDVPNSDYNLVRADSLLAPGTAWATLHTIGDAAGLSGAFALAEAHANLRTVKPRLDAAVASIGAETDDQSNDVVPKAVLDDPGFQDLESGVAQADAALAGTVTISVTDSNQQPFDLQIDLARFFVPGIADLKTKLPQHSFDVNHDPQLVLPITFADPTITGIFPDMTNARWQQLTGAVSPTVAAR